MVPFQTIPPSEPFGWKDFFDSLWNISSYYSIPLPLSPSLFELLRCRDRNREKVRKNPSVRQVSLDQLKNGVIQ